MTPTEFRAALARMDLSQSDFARVLQRLGDARPWPTVLRTVQELASKDRIVAMPWSVVALLRLMERAPRGWQDAA